MSEPPAEFHEHAAACGIAFEPGDVDRLGRFIEMLLEANRSFNLTAITDPVAAWMRHVLDSLTLLGYLQAIECASVADLGSGGGVPAIPLAIARPDIAFTLIEATGKKARFCASCAEQLGLSSITVVNDRAETVAAHGSPLRGSFDVVTARAVGRLPVLLELAIPLARVGGMVLAIKGDQAAAEIEEAKQALHALHARVVATDRTPTGTVVAIEKLRQTPRAYPRRPGEPKRAPL